MHSVCLNTSNSLIRLYLLLVIIHCIVLIPLYISRSIDSIVYFLIRLKFLHLLYCIVLYCIFSYHSSTDSISLNCFHIAQSNRTIYIIVRSLQHCSYHLSYSRIITSHELTILVLTQYILQSYRIIIAPTPARYIT